MSDPAVALQGALVTFIKGLNTEAGSRVYDTVPANPTFPYVTIGPGQGVPLDEDCFDRQENTLQVDVWSRATGYPEAKRISGAIRDGLHANPPTIVVTGFDVDTCIVRSVDYSRDPDGLTSRARLLVEIETEPA